MKPVTIRALIACATLAALGGCGGGGSGGGSGGGGTISTPTPAPNPAPTPAPTPVPTTPSFFTAEYDRSTGPGLHNAVAAWQAGATGQGVTLAIIDSGIDTASPEFAGRIAASSADVVEPAAGGAARSLVNPDSDHGTRVAQVAAAARDNVGVMGIAWQATVQMLRADTPGTCATPETTDGKGGCEFDDSDIARGVDRAISAGARVLNLSLGGSAPLPVLQEALARAAQAGIVVVVSAGNDGASTEAGIDPNTPDPFASGLRAAGSGNVLIAGSVNERAVLSSFSNRAGAEKDWFLAALGESVCCTYENGVMKVSVENGQSFVTLFSGTSFSAPQVAGAAALLRQAFPNLSAAQVVDLLLRSARDLGDAGADAIYGRGLLDIAAAFQPQGTTSLAGSTALVPLGDTVAVTSAAMGDATAQLSLRTVMLDGYGRAYGVDLAAGIHPAAPLPRLAPSLAGVTRRIGGGSDALALAFAVDGAGEARRLPWRGLLHLGPDDAGAARVLAAHVSARIAPRARLAFGYGQGADGLGVMLRGTERPAFLIAADPLDDTGFARSGQTALAVRRTLDGGTGGHWGLTLSAERGAVVSGAPMRFADGLGSLRRRDGIWARRCGAGSPVAGPPGW